MKKPESGPGDVILEVKSDTHLHKIILCKDTLEIIMGPNSYIFDLEKITNIAFFKGSEGLFTGKPAEIKVVGQSRYWKSDGNRQTDIWHIFLQPNQNDEINKFIDTFYKTQKSSLQRKVDRKKREEKERLIQKKQQQRDRLTREKQQQIDRAKERERALDYDSAIEIWEDLGAIKEAARVRKLKAEQGAVKVSQKVVHGDEVSKTEIKDSVVSKSNIGAGGDGDGLAAKLQQLAQMHRDGILSDEQFEAAKNKLLN